MASNRIGSKLESAANVAIVAVCILAGIFFGQKWLAGAGPAAPAPAPPSTISKGDPVKLDQDWSKNGSTLLLVLQKGCHFCTESAPFYKRLLAETAGNPDLRMVAVLPTSTEESKGYLNELGVDISEVQQASLSNVDVRGTPTLILVDNTGKVVDSWVGKLPPEKENTVLQALNKHQGKL